LLRKVGPHEGVSKQRLHYRTLLAEKNQKIIVAIQLRHAKSIQLLTENSEMLHEDVYCPKGLTSFRNICVNVAVFPNICQDVSMYIYYKGPRHLIICYENRKKIWESVVQKKVV
jgi:hypothetical protein